MNGTSEFVYFAVYAFFAILGFVFLKTAWRLRSSYKSLTFLLFGILAILMIPYCKSEFASMRRKAELEYVGRYCLISYPNCKTCTLDLKKENTYTVKNGDTLIENGKWHFESGQDFWIVYIGDHGQLGSGEYLYTTSAH